jgi:hypothetical protein
MSESKLVKAALEYLSYRGIGVWRNNTGAVVSVYKGRKRIIRYGKKGSSDIIGLIPGGRFIGVECKQPKEKQTLDQRLFQQFIESLGGLYVLARNLDDIQEALDGTRQHTD